MSTTVLQGTLTPDAAFIDFQSIIHNLLEPGDTQTINVPLGLKRHTIWQFFNFDDLDFILGAYGRLRFLKNNQLITEFPWIQYLDGFVGDCPLPSRPMTSRQLNFGDTNLGPWSTVANVFCGQGGFPLNSGGNVNGGADLLNAVVWMVPGPGGTTNQLYEFPALPPFEYLIDCDQIQSIFDGLIIDQSQPQLGNYGLFLGYAIRSMLPINS